MKRKRKKIVRRKNTRHRRNPRNPWDGLTIPIEKKVRKLCLNSDLSLTEISKYLNIPLSWVQLSCDKSQIKHRISIKRKRRRKARR